MTTPERIGWGAVGLLLLAAGGLLWAITHGWTI